MLKNPLSRLPVEILREILSRAAGRIELYIHQHHYAASELQSPWDLALVCKTWSFRLRVSGLIFPSKSFPTNVLVISTTLCFQRWSFASIVHVFMLSLSSLLLAMEGRRVQLRIREIVDGARPAMGNRHTSCLSRHPVTISVQLSHSVYSSLPSVHRRWTTWARGRLGRIVSRCASTITHFSPRYSKPLPTS